MGDGDSLDLFTVNKAYVEYLSSVAPTLYAEKQSTGARPRKYVGIVFLINGYKYFAPLTSFKKKHLRLSDSIDFIKISHIAAININMMFPVPDTVFERVSIKEEQNTFYRNLLNRELRFIKANENKIKTNASIVYQRSIRHPESKLTKRCNDFKKLEEMCHSYSDCNINSKTKKINKQKFI